MWAASHYGQFPLKEPLPKLTYKGLGRNRIDNYGAVYLNFTYQNRTLEDLKSIITGISTRCTVYLLLLWSLSICESVKKTRKRLAVVELWETVFS